MVQLLVRRSCGSFQRLAVSSIPDDSLFSFIAEHGGSLLSLEVPRSEMSDAVVEQVAGRLSAITFLDISSCKKIGARALRAFGKHCKSLAGLRRTMHPLEVLEDVSQDEEALAIALGMPKLRHLELAYLRITTQGVMEILSHCPELEFLDIRGCWDVKLDEEWMMKKRNVGLKVLGPTIVDSYGCQYCEGCSDSSDYSWESMDDDEDGIMEDDYGDEGEQLQVRFYGGGFNEAYSGFDWLSSP
ncbi:hypothetical protein HPP92_005992 [Vanilla planifolia]|uniref:F-box protein FBW2 n=1 Tax=Vanilla planifolia TaxID=51239 RepID=A0A835V9K7_VANPL|nr:hypothetical protein HPP92_005992 [Vanilla planifolia]